MKKRKVLDKILEACETAIYNGKPILVLRTGEIELIRRIVESDRLVVRLSKDQSQGVDNERILPTAQLPKTTPPLLFVKNKGNMAKDFNIFYVKSDDLKNFALMAPHQYGVPQQSAQLSYPALYILPYHKTSGTSEKDLWDQADLNAFIDRYLMESLSGSALGSSLILLYGDSAKVPETYERYCEIIDEPYPEADEILDCLKKAGQGNDSLSESVMLTLTDALLGLSLLQVERLIRALSIIPVPNNPVAGGILFQKDPEHALKAIVEQKKQILKKENLLEIIATTTRKIQREDDSPLGGMDNFKKWLNSQKESINRGDKLRRDMGVNPPKGVLLCGIPGCGKSFAVETVAATLGIPLLKLDIGRLMGKYVGESEHNMDKALKLAEAMAPCVLFIDELDKGFSGAGKNSEDAGPFKRMFGNLLGWMQQCRKPCFIFATANDISALPKEFFRSGRFDCLYSLYMPTAEECADILSKQMTDAEKKADRAEAIFTTDCFNRKKLICLINNFVKNPEKPRFVTGADIAKLVSMALRAIWTEGKADRRISFDEWKKEIEKALENTSVYGDSRENLDSIAACYVRLMRSNFIPASDHPLFSDEEYIVKEEPPQEGQPESELPKLKVIISNRGTMVAHQYDRVFRAKMTPLLERYGSVMEQNSVRRILQ